MSEGKEENKKKGWGWQIFTWRFSFGLQDTSQKGSKQDRMVTSAMLSLVKTDFPGHVLPTDVLLNCKAKYMREGEWRLTAAGNHEELKPPSSNCLKQQCKEEPYYKPILLPRKWLCMGVHEGTDIQHLNNMITLLFLFCALQLLQVRGVRADKGHCTFQFFPGKSGFSTDKTELHCICQIGYTFYSRIQDNCLYRLSIPESTPKATNRNLLLDNNKYQM